MKKILILAMLSMLFVVSIGGINEKYKDVPENHWATDGIYKAREYDLMKGGGGNKFSFGQTISKSEFVTILCNMFKWEEQIPQTQSFSDVATTTWYYQDVVTEIYHGVIDK